MADRHPLRDRDVIAGRLGHALQALAADLAEERRRASALERENAKLRAELKALKSRT